MGLSAISRCLLLQPEVDGLDNREGPEPDNITRPFRLLDLPKDIRLMVYERLLPISWNRHIILLQDEKHYITLINPSISGIRILATCRIISEEASYVLKPQMEIMLAEAPKIFIDAKQILGLVTLHYGLVYRYDVLDRIMQALKKKWIINAIHQRRKGEYSMSLSGLRLSLGLTGLIKKRDHAAISAIASFILRTAKYAETAPEPRYKYPPITIVVDVPASYQPGTVTTTTSRMIALYYRLATGVRRNRTHTGQARMTWLVRRLAFQLSLKSWLWRTLSISVMLRYTKDEHGATMAVPHVVENGFQAALMFGVNDARNTGQGLLHYGGIVEDEGEENEPV